MAYLDAFTANAFLRDSQGRLVFVASRRKKQAYLVTPERAAQIGRFVRLSLGVMMVGVLVCAILLPWWVTAVIGLGMIATYTVLLRRITRTLELAPEIPVVPSPGAVQRSMAAMGSATIAGVCIFGIALTSLGIVGLRNGVSGLVGWFLVVYGAAVAILYATRWAQLRRRERPDGEL